jgi:hypothetical protein
MIDIVSAQQEKFVARRHHQRFHHRLPPRRVRLHDARHAVAARGQARQTDKRNHDEKRPEIARNIDDIHAGNLAR